MLSRRIAVAMFLTVVVVLALAYIFIETRSGMAVLTEPPPGIPGSYYVTAEAKIYGPVVNLAEIKSKMGGQYASDYSYVQWGSNPFYRVYVDNTLQEVYSGNLIDVLNQLSWVFSVEDNLKTTFDNLKNVGAVDPSSVLGQLFYCGNLPGTYFTVCDSWGGRYVNMNSSGLFAIEAHAYSRSSSTTTVVVNLNGSECASATAVSYSYGVDEMVINATGISNGNMTFQWGISMSKSGTNPQYSHAGVTIYLSDLHGFDTNIASSAYRVYNVIDSPGTGFVSKYISPSSPVAGSGITVTARLDPPSAENVNITDKYPNSFTWGSVDAILEKYKVGMGLQESLPVHVVPVADGSNMTFTIHYNEALSILQSMASDEYVYLTYSLLVPDTPGEYTLPSATMTYEVTIP